VENGPQVYRELRKRDILRKADLIVEGKRRKRVRKLDNDNNGDNDDNNGDNDNNGDKVSKM
jgi:hypothetical protein